MKMNNVILKTTVQVSFFIIFLFSIHIFLAGHFAPGGGFVGGLLTASALVLLLLTYDIKTVQKLLPINYMMMTAVGLALALGTASISVFFGDAFFKHYFSHFEIPLLGNTELHTAMLFDSGVYLVVVGVTMIIIQSIGGDE
ncbi:Na(+)/H(+) antiporter subunit B [Kurthia zopfii]|uniref:Multiple resistance and pH homeostasis protein B n=1 Tax=Kurthia zopfii TaxID=1650 RepID=A0A2U3AGE1_9BACL|nr:Na(+)/H(+) antiporter subunit B [Kurthia zopfii]PWI23587.1 Na(+)/H(+) antiporter subunit B [Kurthia zopfii]TDR42732.1 multisubunit sodium/proton antiporter MrpB subunit [Kurthia zopfii]STX10431.1 Multiple resistance and pH homeostasis protein B [Kurthia zopfii]VEI08658.1 Multiple resistance and pH homeostasis protein B [Kurthia zopfii]GEK30205.1 Na(+)/H(+) antiporter subunit B [Kurthia zopfii]